MELFQLHSFLRVAEAGNISRAAEILHLSQPAITKQIHALERELKTPLFDRTGRGVELTAAGRVLCDYAGRSLALLEEGRQAIGDVGAGATGQLAIGCGVTTGIFQLPAWLHELQCELPGIDVTVRTGESREIVNLALERHIDLGLITSPVEHPDLQMIPLYEEEIVLVCPGQNTRVGSRIRLENLADYPLILFPRDSGFRDYLEQQLNAVGAEMQVKMESDSIEAILRFVAAGLGSSFLPEVAVAGDVATGALQQVRITGLPPLKRQTSLIYRRDRYQTAGARTFLQLLREQYKVKREAG